MLEGKPRSVDLKGQCDKAALARYMERGSSAKRLHSDYSYRVCSQDSRSTSNMSDVPRFSTAVVVVSDMPDSSFKGIALSCLLDFSVILHLSDQAQRDCQSG